MPPENQRPTRQELFQGALASVDELIAAQTEKLRLLQAHRKGLIQKFSKEINPPPQQNENAKKIVDFLLQDGLQSSCSGCEREFSVKVPAATHGLCKRHTIDSYRQIEKTNPGANYAQKIAEIETRPDSAFPPDLGSPENRQFLNSLEKVDFAKKDADQKAYLDQWRASRGMAKI